MAVTTFYRPNRSPGFASSGVQDSDEEDEATPLASPVTALGQVGAGSWLTPGVSTGVSAGGGDPTPQTGQQFSAMTRAERAVAQLELERATDLQANPLSYALDAVPVLGKVMTAARAITPRALNELTAVQIAENEPYSDTMKGPGHSGELGKTPAGPSEPQGHDPFGRNPSRDSPGAASGGESGGFDSRGLAHGGPVTDKNLVGLDPPGPDDGYGALDRGEFVVSAAAAQMYGPEVMEAINQGLVPPQVLRAAVQAYMQGQGGQGAPQPAPAPPMPVSAPPVSGLTRVR